MKVALTKKGAMRDIPEKFRGLYDSYKMLILFKDEKLTRKELIEKCKRNRTLEGYTHSDNTYYKWIREWIGQGLIEIDGHGRDITLSLSENGKWLTDAQSGDEFLERLGKLGA